MYWEIRDLRPFEEMLRDAFARLRPDGQAKFEAVAQASGISVFELFAEEFARLRPDLKARLEAVAQAGDIPVLELFAEAIVNGLTEIERRKKPSQSPLGRDPHLRKL